MARTPSNMIELGTSAPDFRLLDTIWDKPLSRDECRREKGLLVMFICNHCPYVKLIEKALGDLGRDFLQSGIGIVAISSNDVVNYPDDHPDKMREKAKELGYTFPYLYDETQDVAKAYGAACTPDFFLFDADLKLVYRGQFDEARPSNDIVPTGKDLRAALDALYHGRALPTEQKPSLGCNIKWKTA